jgi:hypothetical protein
MQKNIFETRRCAITEKEVNDWHVAINDSIESMKKLIDNSTAESFGTHVAVSKLATESINNARKIVEEETLSLIDTMDIAFNETKGALKKLRETNKQLSEESAFIVSSLSGVQRKTSEISEYASQLERLNYAFEKFKTHVDSGLFELAGKCAKAINE